MTSSTSTLQKTLITATAAAVAVLLYYRHRRRNSNNDSRPPPDTILTDTNNPIHRILKLTTHPLKNTYFAVRHGESEANVAGVISCAPEDATVMHGLTEKGREQAQQAAYALERQVNKKLPIHIYASDYKRALETGRVIQSTLRIRDECFHVTSALRERDFGSLHLMNGAENYPRVWALDRQSTRFDKTPENFNAEDVDTLQTRLANLVKQIEATHTNAVIVLATHGDVCGIGRAGFQAVDGRCHKMLPDVHNCEILPFIYNNHNNS